MTKDSEAHINSLGKLYANLQSLELLLRGFLSTIYDSGPDGLTPGMPKDMYDLPVGKTVTVNYMTNYDSLGQLIDRYNDYVQPKDNSLLLNRQPLVDLRDSMAHGRVSGPTPSATPKILKFDKPQGGQVRVVFSQTMDGQWFKSQIRLVYDDMMRVYDACKRFAPSMIV